MFGVCCGITQPHSEIGSMGCKPGNEAFTPMRCRISNLAIGGTDRRFGRVSGAQSDGVVRGVGDLFETA